MRKGKGSGLLALIITAILMSAALPVAAQPDEEFPAPVGESALEGYTRSDGTIVLTDTAFCSFLLGSDGAGNCSQVLSSWASRFRRARAAPLRSSTCRSRRAVSLAMQRSSSSWRLRDFTAAGRWLAIT